MNLQIRALLLLLFLVAAIECAGQVASGYQGPSPVRLMEPQYPDAALRAYGGGGTIHLYLRINSEGRVYEARAFGPTFSCGKPDPDSDQLREAAVAAARQTIFTPATRNGVAVDGTYVVVYKVASRPSSTPKETKVAAAARNEPTPDAPEAKPMKPAVVNGRAISLPKPKFPPEMRRNPFFYSVSVSEAVSVSVMIDEEGNIISVSPADGHPLYMAAAAEAACQAKFSPTLLSGMPVKVTGIITYNFVP